MKLLKNLNPLSRSTLKLHLIAAPFDGMAQAGLALFVIIARKSLGANDFQVMLFTMTAPLCFLLSIYWAELIRVFRHWRTLFLLTAVIGVVPLVLMIPFGNVQVLLGLMLLFHLGTSLYVPLRNRVIQNNYPVEPRSHLYSQIARVITLTALLLAWPLGLFLDSGADNWRWLFLFVALVASVDRVLQYLVPENPVQLQARVPIASPGWMGVPVPRWSHLVKPWQRMRDVLNRNRQFFRWEMQFMIYGLAFFIIFTLLPGFLVEGLGMSYSKISLGQVAIAQLGSVIMLPVMGKFHDRLNPASFAGRVFLLLSLFPVLLIVTGLTPAGNLRMLPFLLSFLLQGIAMSGVIVAWSLSSMTFAGEEDGALYQSIHVTLTGMRGMLGPLIGWAVKTWFGWYAAFALSALLLLVAALLMLSQGRQLERDINTQAEPVKPAIPA